MKVAIIGAGLIGQERIESLRKLGIQITSVYDVNSDVLSKVKDKYNVRTDNIVSQTLATYSDWVFIATPNDVSGDIIKKAFQYGSNVLVEKPFGRDYAECQEIIKSKPDNKELYVGFNYRFFDGIEQALNDAKSGKFGQLISVNIIIAHGNSPGMEKSWRFTDKKEGCFTDLGVHTIDLMTQLTDNIHVEFAKSWKGFWNTGIDEEAHYMATGDGIIFNAQVSFNRWRSNFRLEINGTEGYGIVEGRGRSYGNQSYRTGTRWGWLKANKKQSETEVIHIKDNDCSNSFTKEIVSILNLDNYQYGSLSKACDYKNASKIMNIFDVIKFKMES